MRLCLCIADTHIPPQHNQWNNWKRMIARYRYRQCLLALNSMRRFSARGWGDWLFAPADDDDGVRSSTALSFYGLWDDAGNNGSSPSAARPRPEASNRWTASSASWFAASAILISEAITPRSGRLLGSTGDSSKCRNNRPFVSSFLCSVYDSSTRWPMRNWRRCTQQAPSTGLYSMRLLLTRTVRISLLASRIGTSKVSSHRISFALAPVPRPCGLVWNTRSPIVALSSGHSSSSSCRGLDVRHPSSMATSLTYILQYADCAAKSDADQTCTNKRQRCTCLAEEDEGRADLRAAMSKLCWASLRLCGGGCYPLGMLRNDRHHQSGPTPQTGWLGGTCPCPVRLFVASISRLSRNLQKDAK